MFNTLRLIQGGMTKYEEIQNSCNRCGRFYWFRYVVIELKRGKFKPEYIGKVNFYCSAVDDILRREGDEQTVGLLLCQTKDKVKAEYALRDINKPIGISEYELGQALPEQLRSALPTIEEIENNLNKNNID